MGNKGYAIKDDVIIIQRELTELDLFLKHFLDILKKHSDYLVVNGFASICSGRTRATEDIDVLFPIMKSKEFEKFFVELKRIIFGVIKEIVLKRFIHTLRGWKV